MVLIFVIIGLVAACAGFYVFKIYLPGKDLKAAQTEVVRWELRFQLALDCLLGKKPGSAKTSEALAIREMSPDPWDRGGCTPMIKKLSRGEANDTGIPALEDAWGEVDKASTKAAVAFVQHVSKSTMLAEDSLPAALDALDEARRVLRATAKLPETKTSGPALASAQTLWLADGDSRLLSLEISDIPSAGGLVAYGRTENRTVQIALPTGGAPVVRRLGPGSARALPDMTWGATPTATGVRAGAFDAEGVIAGPSVFTMEAARIAGVGGTLANGVLVYTNEAELVFARATNGAVTTEMSTDIVLAGAAVDLDGRTAVVWSTLDSSRGRIMKPGGTDEAVLELPLLIDSRFAAPPAVCLTAERAWTQTWESAISFGGGRSIVRKRLAEEHATVGPRLQGCTKEAALFHDHRKPDRFAICTDDCRMVKLPTGAPSFAVTAVAGKLVAIAARGGVLGVWREDRPATFYSLPEVLTPVLANEWPAMALTDGKVIDVLARGKDTFAVIRIPAS